MDESSEKLGTNDEHFTIAMRLVTSSSLPMVMLTVIKLKVFDAIAKAGPDARLSALEIASRLSIPNPGAGDMIDRMLRLLASHLIVTCTQMDIDSKPVRVYGLTPVAKYFIPNEDGISLGPVMELAQGQVFIESWYKLKDCVLEGGIPFDRVHGANTFEYPALNASFNALFNKCMVNHATIVMTGILRCYDGFEKLNSVVDVGGGLGATLNMIVSKYPSIKGTNYDLPHVLQDAPKYNGIEHVGGDFFHHVPQADAIFMKWILHDWSNDHCVKLLRNCYKALPDNGKVIVVEAILPFIPDSSIWVQANTNTDAIMMTQDPGGRERTEDEFLALAKEAGFSSITKEGFACNHWVMEFHK